MTLEELIHLRHQVQAGLVRIQAAAESVNEAEKAWRDALLALRQAQSLLAKTESVLRTCIQAGQQIPQTEAELTAAQGEADRLMQELQSWKAIAVFLGTVGKPGPGRPVQQVAWPSELKQWMQRQIKLGRPRATVLKILAAAAEKPGARLSFAQLRKWQDLLRAQIRQVCRILQMAQAKVQAVQVQLREKEKEHRALQVAAAQAALKSLRQEGARLQARYLQALERLIPDLDARVPLALLPVRLETRYVNQGSGVDLLVRIYPDDIHQDSHETGLTDEEISRGRTFWEQWWRLGNAAAEADSLNTWNFLVSRYGPGRAAWIAHRLAPINPDVRPAAAVPVDQELNPPPEFPEPEKVQQKPSHAARARALPDRWAALGYQKGQRTRLSWGELIPNTLATGPDPAAQPDPAQGVDAGMRWMVNFEEAEKKGMGLRLHFQTGEDTTLERLLVVGVKATLDPETSAGAWEDLLEAHQHTWGLSLVPQDTPTNNTDEVRSGYAGKPDLATSLKVTMGDSLSTLLECDGNLLQRALGLASDALAHVRYADGREQEAAGQMQAVLWPAVWEYYLYNHLTAEGFPGGADLPASRDFLRPFRDFYTRCVRARGPLPALRVGNQPYGVLPVTSLKHWVTWEVQPEAMLLRWEEEEITLYVAWDLAVPNGWSTWEAVDGLPLTKPASVRSLALCLSDLHGMGDWSLLCLVVAEQANDPADRVLVGLGTKLNAKGAPLTWQWLNELPDCPEPGINLASGLAVADRGPDGEAEIWVLRIQRRSQGQRGAFACLSRGSGLAPNGSAVARWQQSVILPNLSGDIKGAGLAAVRFSEKGTPKAVVFYAAREKGENRLYLGVGKFAPRELKDLNALLPPGDLTEASFATYASPGGWEILVVCTLQNSGQTIWCLFRGQGLDSRGGVAHWTQVGDAWPDSAARRLALAAGDLGRAPGLGFQKGVAGTVNSLQALRELWTISLEQGRVPHLGRPGSNLDQDVVETLALEGVSRTYALRNLFGRDLMEHLARLSGMSTAIQPNLRGIEGLGLQDARLSRGMFHEQNQPLTLPLVQVEPLSETEPLHENYIQWLAQADPRDIQNHLYPKDEPKALLYQLLRYAILWAYAGAAFRLTDLWPSSTHHDPELVFSPKAGLGTTPWKRLEEMLLNVGTFSDPELDAFLDNLRQLGRQPSAVLERMLTATLDLNGHRLDAWVTGLATQRLWELRRQRPRGIILGGYGWVENLSPRLAGLSQSQGYTHAPSLAQATAAAVLRSGYLSHQDLDSGADLALDLSSRRVRLALELMEGIRQGQPLGALLGYRFERGLHDGHPGLELDATIAIFRKLYPLVAGKLTPPDQAAESVAADNVVDGLSLLRYWQQYQAFFDSAAHPNVLVPAAGPEHDAIVAELQGLADITDACSDLALAESVYQAVQGNHMRAAAGLNALARGEVPPPELEVIRTSRRGWANTHRLLAVWNPRSGEAPFSAWNSQTLRAKAEPGLNQWAEQLMGDPAQIRCRVAYLDRQTRAELALREISLAQLGLCPLDALYLPLVSETVQQSDWEGRLLDYARVHRPASLPANADVQLTFARDPLWSREVLGFPEFVEAVRTLREFVLQARALDARDMALPGQVRGPDWDVDELSARAQALWDEAQARLAQASRLLLAPGGDALRDALRDLAEFFVSQAIPLASGDSEPELRILQDQLNNAVKEFAPKVKSTESAATQEGDLDFALRRFETLLGKDFRVLPLISQFPLVLPLEEALQRRAQAQDAPAPEVWGWLQSIARVREGVARWNRALACSEALAGVPCDEIRIAQLPSASDDRWLELQPLPAQNPSGGCLCLAIQSRDNLDWRSPVVGLVVDDWVEVIPRGKELTGLSFHYDAPGSCAPQSLLLAVSPDPRRRWSLDSLEGILLETLEAAKTRAVDLESLAAGGHYLPALCLAFNSANETFSTKFD